jgi:hypothetical protein
MYMSTESGTAHSAAYTRTTALKVTSGIVGHHTTVPTAPALTSPTLGKDIG